MREHHELCQWQYSGPCSCRVIDAEKEIASLDRSLAMADKLAAAVRRERAAIYAYDLRPPDSDWMPLATEEANAYMDVGKALREYEKMRESK